MRLAAAATEAARLEAREGSAAADPFRLTVPAEVQPLPPDNLQLWTVPLPAGCTSPHLA